MQDDNSQKGQMEYIGLLMKEIFEIVERYKSHGQYALNGELQKSVNGNLYEINTILDRMDIPQPVKIVRFVNP